MTVDFVALSYACDRNVRELGEDERWLEKVDHLVTTALAGIMLARHAVHSERARTARLEMELGLSDTMHDASWRGLCDDAKQASVEAKVRPIRMPATGELRLVPK